MDEISFETWHDHQKRKRLFEAIWFLVTSFCKWVIIRYLYGQEHKFLEEYDMRWHVLGLRQEAREYITRHFDLEIPLNYMEPVPPREMPIFCEGGTQTYQEWWNNTINWFAQNESDFCRIIYCDPMKAALLATLFSVATTIQCIRKGIATEFGYGCAIGFDVWFWRASSAFDS